MGFVPQPSLLLLTSKNELKMKMRFLIKAIFLVLAVPTLGYLLIRIHIWHNVSQDMKNFLGRNEISFKSQFCHYDNGFSRGYCTFSGTSQQVHKLVEKLKLDQIDTDKSIESFNALDSKILHKPEMEKAINQAYIFFRVRDTPCWSKLSEKTPNIEVYELFGNHNQLNLRYGTSYSSFILLYSNSTSEGCILFNYAGMR
jgi:hypothetical protein